MRNYANGSETSAPSIDTNKSHEIVRCENNANSPASDYSWFVIRKKRTPRSLYGDHPFSWFMGNVCAFWSCARPFHIYLFILIVLSWRICFLMFSVAFILIRRIFAVALGFERYIWCLDLDAGAFYRCVFHLSLVRLFISHKCSSWPMTCRQLWLSLWIVFRLVWLTAARKQITSRNLHAKYFVSSRIHCSCTPSFFWFIFTHRLIIARQTVYERF